MEKAWSQKLFGKAGILFLSGLVKARVCHGPASKPGEDPILVGAVLEYHKWQCIFDIMMIIIPVLFRYSVPAHYSRRRQFKPISATVIRTLPSPSCDEDSAEECLGPKSILIIRAAISSIPFLMRKMSGAWYR